MTNGSEGPARRSGLRIAIGWIALVALDGYVTFLHQGLGSAPGGWASQWWHPTQFLLLNPTVGGWADVPLQGTLLLSIPALLIAALVFYGTGSAIARTLAVTLCVAGVAICTVAFSPSGIWEQFHWRMSVLLLLISLCIGVAIMSPALARAWLRRGVVVRLLLYLPVAFAVVALMRNATGTDENLAANISPWPAVTVFGLEMGAYTIVGGLFGLAIGLGALAVWRRRPALALVGVVAGCVFPALWFRDRFSNTGADQLVFLVILTAIALGLASITRGSDRGARLAKRAAIFALGAALVIAPIIAGRAWAAADYTVNKFVRAQTIMNALAKYYEKESVYPDSLAVLTEQNYLEELPHPRVGFDFLYAIGFLPPVKFSYRSLGSSYVLEFNSTEWVQCAYNPPWSAAAAGGEYDEEYADEEGEYEDESTGAWSCPDTRPALWGNDAGGEDGEYEEERDGE